MKNMLLWDKYNHYFIDQHGQYFLQEKPVFSFSYDSIVYHEGVQKNIFENNTLDLEENQCIEIENYIQQKRTEVGILKHCVDSNGKYLGFVNKDAINVSKIVDQSPPTADSFWIWDENVNQWKRGYYYDNEGKLVDSTSPLAVGFTLVPPPVSVLSQKWDKNTEIWIDNYTIDELNKYKNIESLNLVYTMLSVLNSNTDIKIVLDELNNILGDSFKYQLTKTTLQEISNANTVNDVVKTVQSVRDILLFIE